MPRGITRRWLINGFGVVVLLILILEIIFAVAFRHFSYQGIENTLFSYANTSYNLFETYLGDAGYDLENGMRNFVENFEDKELVEVQMLDQNGGILFTSTGFTPVQSTLPDWEAALKNEDKKAVWHGRTTAGENVMAVTSVLTNSAGETLGAVRYVVSLRLVDRQVTIVVTVAVLVGLGVLFFVMLTSSYFVSSIINPVKEIGRGARKIAMGDYNSRIEKKYDDEIGDLCDTINYMAGEIATTEKLKNEFISSVSHELRTPLTAIKGWSETLRQAGPEDRELMEKGLDVITGEAERLSGIVEELLDFSRMQSGRITMKCERMDVLAELEETAVLFRERAKREGLELTYIEQPSLPPVMGDKDRLKQVFVNVVDNAIKYSKPGGKIRIEAADMGRTVQIVISDSGIGISKENLGNVKNKFFRVKNGPVPGSGIGLALADEIVRRHGGRLDIDSEEGVGTTVTITLPVAPPEGEPERMETL